MEKVFATDDKEYIKKTLPELIALWMLTVEEASSGYGESDALSQGDQSEEFRREDFEYMLKLLDISIAHIEQDSPDTTHNPMYVGPERRQRHPLVENVVHNLHTTRKRKKRG
jgi:hypothetical protein